MAGFIEIRNETLDAPLVAIEAENSLIHLILSN